jgi:hypothetical protein
MLGLIEFAIGSLKSYIVSKSSLALRKSERTIAIPTVQKKPPRRIEIEIKWEKTKIKKVYL